MILEQQIPQAIRNEFLNKLETISKALKIDKQWLLAVMYKESRIKADAVNKLTGATGLIQFMPKTAIALGTSTTLLLKMNSVQQLDYVYKYLKRFTGKMNSFFDVYFAIFYPVAMGKPDNYEIGNSPNERALIAKQNSGMNLDKNGTLTVGEVKKWMSIGFKDYAFATIKAFPTVLIACVALVLFFIIKTNE